MAALYIDTDNFITASNLWTDSNLTVVAADGFYQVDGIYREMANGELLASKVCPSCAIPCGGAITASGNQGIYYLNMDLGVDIGAVVIKFQPYGVPDGLSSVFNGVTYDEMSSQNYGYSKSYVGSLSSNCGLPTSISDPDFTGTLNVFQYNPSTMSYDSTGTTEPITVNYTEVSLTSGSPGLCYMVVPKTTASPSLIEIKAVGPCSGTAFQIEVLCPSPLQSFSSSVSQTSSSSACPLSLTNTYYYVNVSSSPTSYPGLHDLVFVDQNGVSKLPAGFYKVSSSVYIEVGPDGTVISTGTCPTSFDSFTIFFDSSTSPNTYGFSDRSSACAGTGVPLTVYITGTVSSIEEAVTTGKFLYTDSGRTISLDGNNTYYKTASTGGDTFQVGIAGDMFNWGGPC
jgi:hypothetical protein